MNMKKTMAAIAAGAVAVSAMATTVSAEDANTLWGNKTVTFNLVQTVKEVTGYKGTIVSTIDRLTLVAGSLDIEISDLDNDDVVTVSGYYLEDSTPIRTMVFTKNPDDARYTPAGAARVTVADAANSGVGKVTIPVEDTTYDKDFTIDVGSSGSAQVFLNVVIEKSVGFTVVRGVGDTRDTAPYYENSKKVREALAAGNVRVAFDDGTSTYSSDPTESSITAALPTSADGWEKIDSTKKYPYMSNKDTRLGGAVTKETLGYSGNVLGCVFKTGEAGSRLETSDDMNIITKEHIPAYYVSNIINDALNSYGNVTFTFNTYKGKLANDDDNTTTFNKNWWQLDQGDVNGLFDDTNYWINNWENMSLFNSALIVNSNLTFSLSDAQAMKWTRDSLTFDWDDIQAAALNPNVLTNYINSMVLRTGETWYWESLVVEFEEGVAEEVTAGAGDEADDNQIVEDPEDDSFTDDEDDWGDDDEDDDWGDDDEDDDDGEDDGEEDNGDVDNTADVSSPKTGNPAVALAVIPVALAAAAVVAKKRG